MALNLKDKLRILGKTGILDLSKDNFDSLELIKTRN